jgi:putative hemolysin
MTPEIVSRHGDRVMTREPEKRHQAFTHHSWRRHAACQPCRPMKQTTPHTALQVGYGHRPESRNPALASSPSGPILEARWARHEDEVQAAQRLRHQVFAQELGAMLQPPEGTPPGLDADRFDPYCEHLLVVAREHARGPEQVVGTYRLLTPAGARLAGGLYTETEFEFSGLQGLLGMRPHLAELGRSCTDPGWRQGGVIMMLWSHLVQFMARNGIDCVIGCASVPMHDGGHAAASLWQRLKTTHLAAPGLRVLPRLPLPLEQLRADLPVEAPPLVKGYLACGAKVLGAPAWDPDFGCADLPMLLNLADLPPGYRRRFLGAAG